MFFEITKIFNNETKFTFFPIFVVEAKTIWAIGIFDL